MELLGGRDDLGAATLHGSSQVSRIRRGSSARSSRALDGHPARTSIQSSSTGSRRSQMKRAMSKENVMPPEDYASTSNHHKVYEPEPQVRRGGRRPPSKQEPAVVEEEEDEHSSCGSTSSEESGTSFGGDEEGGANDEEGGSSFAEEEEEEDSAKRSTQPQPRGLLSLMRDNETVELADLQSKKNRRVLHFLLYQHKLDIDMVQLQSDIDHDIAVNGLKKALQRPALPLYVEPAN